MTRAATISRQYRGAPSGPTARDRRRAPDFVAETDVVVAPNEVFAFLADLENHWLLTGSRVQVLSLTGPPGARDGGTVRIRGPLGIGRAARTKVLAAREPAGMSGRAEIGKGTVAVVSWTLSATRDGSHVRLEAILERVGPLDRLTLALGGRRVMRKVFSQTLRNLAARFAGNRQGQEV